MQRTGVALLFLSALCLGRRAIQSAECGNLVDAQTDARRSKQGTTVVLKMHAEDDHAKDSHMCMSNYSFAVTRADGTSLHQDITSVDDSYGRAIKFWIDGFANAGQRVIATILDPAYTIIDYDLRTGKTSELDIAPSFLNRLGNACRNAVRVSGVSRGGYVVVSTGGAGCGPVKRWRMEPGLLVRGIQQHAKMEPLHDTATIEPIE